MRLAKWVGVVALLTIMVGAAVAADVSGAWKATMQGRGGQQMEVTFNFKAEGEKLSGTMSNPMGETEIQEGKVSGDNVSFKVKREWQGNAMTINYEGTVSGDEIKFKSTVEGSDRPPREFVAKKVS